MTDLLPGEIATEQGSEEWLGIRHGYVTPSKFKILCTGRPATVEKYFAELQGPPPAPMPANEACSWGIEHEPEAIAKASKVLKVEIWKRGFFVHPDLERVGGSPDGLIVEGGKVVSGVEVKCPFNPENHLKTMEADAVPTQYRYQVQGYMWLFNVPSWWYVSYDPNNEERSLFVLEVLREEEMVARIDERVRWFHQQLTEEF